MRKLITILLLFVGVIANGQMFNYYHQRTSGGGSSYLDVLNDGNTFLWLISTDSIDYNPSDSLIQYDGTYDYWEDYLGSGDSLRQITGDWKWYGDSIRSQATNSKFENNLNVDSIPNPVVVFMVLKFTNVNNWSNIFIGRSGDDQTLRTNGSGDLIMSSNAVSSTSTTIPSDWFILRYIIDGADSYMQIMNNSAITFPSHTSDYTTRMELYSAGNIGNYYSEIIVRKSTSGISALYDYLYDKYSARW